MGNWGTDHSPEEAEREGGWPIMAPSTKVIVDDSTGKSDEILRAVEGDMAFRST